LTQQEFETRFAYTPVWRTGREGLARNAAIALGNAGDTEAISALETAIQSDPDPVVREAAAWSLAKLKN
jgi:epoxyqueuosine reductase